MNVMRRIFFASILLFGVNTSLWAGNITLLEDSFEDSSTNWESRSSETVAISSETAHSGNQSLKVSNRTAVWHGSQLTSSEFKNAGTYTVECYVSFINDNYTSHKFQLCWQNTADGSTSYPTISEATCTNGNWAKLSGTFTIIEGMTNVAVYVQTAYTDNPTDKDLMDFYIDDFTCQKAEEESYDIESLSNGISLKKQYSPYFKIGTAVTASELALPKAKPLIDYHFNSITPGNELKPDALLNQSQCQKDNKPAVKLSSNAKYILQYCSDNHIPIRGHCLVWHSQTPAWFFREGFKANGTLLDKESMTKRMEEYIKSVIEVVTTSYPDLEIYAWDVVNEAFGDGDGKLRKAGSNASNGESPWTEIYGDQSFIDSAFTFARKYAPKGCKLYYNDFNEYIDSKRNAIYELVSRLYKNGTCDGLGMQSHLATSYPSVSLYKTALDKFSQIGCDLQVTELDITIENGATVQTQAKMYSDLFDLYIKYADHISAVVFWGTQDGTSWRSNKNPLVFDAQFKPKEAFFSIIDGLEMPSGIGCNNSDSHKLKVYGTNNSIVLESVNGEKVMASIYNIEGRNIGCYYVEGRREISLPNGTYIVDKQKIMVW